MSKPLKVIGTRPIRHDGVDKVTGRAVYGNDVSFPGMAHGKVLRSPHAHAKIKSVDTSAAAKLPGVYAVCSGKDFLPHENAIAELGEGAVNLAHLVTNCMAKDKVYYRGQAVAAVAAINAHVAEEALKLIKIDYEVLPAVTWVLDAMKPDAPILHADLKTDEGGKSGAGNTNIGKHIHFEQGNAKDGFAKADLVVEREFRLETVHQGYIEPHVATALWNADGRITVWTVTQGSFSVRAQVAELFHIPVSKVTVIPCEIGGGFGGKIRVYLEPVAAQLSKMSGRPVKIQMERSAVFEGTGPTPGAFVRVKLGAKKDGTLVAGEAYLAYESGAYPGGMLGPGCMCVFSCYEIPNAVVDGYEVCLNKPHISAYRAPGATQAAFACEQVVDEIALKLKLDPIEIRLKNAVKEGSRRVDGPVYPKIGLVEVLEAAKNSEHYKSKLEGKNRGRGIACGFWFNAGLKSACSASVNADGTVNLLEGSTDIGGSRTAIAMQLAEPLGIRAEDVVPKVVDTDSVGYTDVTGGSRVTFATGLAAIKAANEIIAMMTTRAAELWECKPEEVKFDDGRFNQINTGSKNGTSLGFKELAAKLSATGEAITVHAAVDPQGSTNGFGCHICDLEVDPETGKTKVLRYTTVQDAGRAVHRSYCEGQLQGGTVQGIGWALNEEYFYDKDGRMRNASYLDYRMPTALDLPMIETIIVECPNPAHPYGVRGVGETPIVPPPAAVANAIHAAVGTRMTECPMAPHKVWKALQSK